MTFETHRHCASGEPCGWVARSYTSRIVGSSYGRSCPPQTSAGLTTTPGQWGGFVVLTRTPFYVEAGGQVSEGTLLVRIDKKEDA